MNKRRLTQLLLLALSLKFSTVSSAYSTTSPSTYFFSSTSTAPYFLQSASLSTTDSNQDLESIKKNLLKNTNLIHETIKQDNYNIKLIVVITCIVTLGFILFTLISRLTRKRKPDKLLSKKNNILENAGIGVLSISPNYMVESNRNKIIHDLFHRSDFEQVSILDLLASIVDHATCKKTRQFLDLAFDSKTSEQHINNGNPLKYFTVYKKDKYNKVTPCYMQSEVKRVFHNKKVSKLLLLIQDRTENIKKQAPIYKKNREPVPAQYFKEVTQNSNKRVIRTFIEDTVLMINELESLIRKNESSQSSARENLQYIARINQKLVNEAKLINYEPLLALSNHFEHQITQLKQKSPLRKADFHGLIPHVNAIKKALKGLSQEVNPNVPSKKKPIRQLSI